MDKLDYKTISKEEFFTLEPDQQAMVLNMGLSELKTLAKVCDVINIDRKHVSKKLRNIGYIFSKVDHQFILPDKKILQKAVKTNAKILKKEFIQENNQIDNSPNANNLKSIISAVNVVSAFNMYYQPCGRLKKIGANVDEDILKAFELICQKQSMVNVSAHISNALALYVQSMSSK